MRWLRRLFPRPRPERGTLTLLVDGHFIIGWPTDQPPRPEQARVLMEEFTKAWTDGSKLFVFPWPVDVTDLRYTRVRL